jgi:hypothetical protein
MVSSLIEIVDNLLLRGKLNLKHQKGTAIVKGKETG